MNPEEVSILVVDDVNAVRVQVSELLRKFGFQKITLTANGEEAKLMMTVERYQLILADWHMAPTDGLDLLKFCRQSPAYQQVAFIMVSAESTKERVIEAIQLGVDDYLIKPLTAAQIQSKIYRALFRRGIFT